MKNKEIELGDTVKDFLTGFVGVVVARTEFFNGCIQFEVMPKVKSTDKTLKEAVGIDKQQLVIVKKYKKEKEQEEVGGAYNKLKKM